MRAGSPSFRYEMWVEVANETVNTVSDKDSHAQITIKSSLLGGGVADSALPGWLQPS